jgi:hypothetical protein
MSTDVLKRFYTTKLSKFFDVQDAENTQTWSLARESAIKLMHELIYDYERMAESEMINEQEYVLLCDGLRYEFSNPEKFHVQILQHYTHMKELEHWKDSKVIVSYFK